MANKSLANKAKLYIKLAADTTKTEVKNVSEITLPNQPYATVEAPGLDQSNGITERIKSSNRTSGDMTFNITVRDAEDAGLLKVAEAYADTDEVAVASQPQFEVAFGDGITATFNGLVVEMNRGALSKDALLTYSVKVEANSVVTYGE